MNTSLQQDFATFSEYLKEIQTICYSLKTTTSLESNLADLRSDSHQRVLEIYEKVNDLRNVMLVKLSYYETENATPDNEYEFHKLTQRFQDLKINFRSALLVSKQLSLQQHIPIELEDGEEETVTGQVSEKSNILLDEKGMKELNTQSKLLDTNLQVTNKLQNISVMLQSSLMTSEVNMQDLSASTNALTNLSNKYSYFADVILKSGKLVNKINESSQAERKQIYRSLYFFIAVCCYIVYRRLLKRPIHLFLWIFFKTFKLILWNISAVLGIMRVQTVDSSFDDIVAYTSIGAEFSESLATTVASTMISVLESSASIEDVATATTTDIGSATESAISTLIDTILSAATTEITEILRDEL